VRRYWDVREPFVHPKPNTGMFFVVEHVSLGMNTKFFEILINFCDRTLIVVTKLRLFASEKGTLYNSIRYALAKSTCQLLIYFLAYDVACTNLWEDCY